MLHKSIVKTLAYYQALGDMPLTTIEIQKFLIKKEGEDRISLFDIQNSLESLRKKDVVSSKNGFFYLKNKDNKNIYEQRIQNIKTTHKKLEKITKISKFLMYIPYVRSISITGSVGLNNASLHSDLDLLIEVRHHRIWSTRFLITGVSMLFKRRRHAEKTNNKLCFNRYMVENTKKRGPSNINYVIKNGALLWKRKNDTKNDFIYAFEPNIFGLFIKNILEFLLNVTGLGILGEKITGKLQIEKIKHNATKYPSHITPLEISASNIFFYYPSILKTEKRYEDILTSFNF